MPTPLDKKSTPDQIRARFDVDVERFSNLTTGQTATVDAPLTMALITQAALATNPIAANILDLGCGAGNNTLKLLQFRSPLNCDLVDLSQPMLDRAAARISEINTGTVRSFQGDFRKLPLPENHYDIILAGAVLHHLRDDRDWEQAFEKLYAISAPGGSVWITDLVWHENPAVQALMWARYSDYLKSLGGPDYRDNVFNYIDYEDSPRPVTYQLELLRKVGFAEVDVLHQNITFAAFGAVKRSP